MQRVLFSIFILAMSIGFVLSPTLAQGDMQSFTSADGSLTLEYPSEWFTDSPVEAYVFASKADLAIDLPDVMPSGEMVLAIFLPEILSQLDLASTAAPPNVVDIASSIFIENPSEAVEIDINGHSAVYTTGSSSRTSADYLVLSVGYDDGTLLMLGVTAPDEIDNALPTFFNIIETINYAIPDPVETSSLATITANNVSNLREVRDLSNDDYSIEQVAVNDDGTLVALNYYSYAEDTESELWLTVINIVTGEVVLNMGSPEFQGLAFSADSSQLLYILEEYTPGYEVIGMKNGVINIATGDTIETDIEISDHYDFYDVNGEEIQILEISYDEETSVSHVVVINPETEGIVHEVDLDMDEIWYVHDLNPDLSTLLVSTKNSLHLYDTSNSELSESLYTSDSEFPEFNAATFSPDGNLIAFTEYEPKSVIVIEVTSGEVVFTVDRSDVDDTLGHVEFSPDGSVLFVTERAGLLVIDVATGEILTQMPQIVDGNLEDFDMSADGRVIIGGGYESVVIWGVPGE